MIDGSSVVVGGASVVGGGSEASVAGGGGTVVVVVVVVVGGGQVGEAAPDPGLLVEEEVAGDERVARELVMGEGLHLTRLAGRVDDHAGGVGHLDLGTVGGGDRDRVGDVEELAADPGRALGADDRERGALDGSGRAAGLDLERPGLGDLGGTVPGAADREGALGLAGALLVGELR